MLHIATIHAFDDRWVNIQINFLRKFITCPFRLYSFLDTHPGNHADDFFFWSLNGKGYHINKLNLLAEIIMLASKSDSDILFFIDGDAFPIGDIVSFVERNISDHPLIAIQRIENNGDLQPHPSFCATTVGFWRDINGDWSKGYHWENAKGKMVSDVGGNLLKMLEDRNINWLPMRRSNKKNLHPLLFGIYNNLIYHHGAGFRAPLLRIDSPFFNNMKKPGRWIDRLEKLPDTKIGWLIKETLNPMRRKAKTIIEENQKLSDSVYQRILADDAFYKELL